MLQQRPAAKSTGEPITTRFSHRELLAGLTDRAGQRYLLGCGAILLVAFAAELGSFTFSTDFYYVSTSTTRPPTSYSADGRLLAELIRFYVFDGILPPTLLLLLGLAALLAAARVFVTVLGCTPGAEQVLASCMFCVHPFFFANFSFINMRLIVPLAVLSMTLAIATGDIQRRSSTALGGLGWALAGLLLYQSALNLAAVTVVIWTAVAVADGADWRLAMRRILIPKLGLLAVALCIYQVGLWALRQQDMLPFQRFESFFQPWKSLDDMVVGGAAHLDAAWNYFTEPSMFFSMKAKAALGALLLLVVIGGITSVRRGRISILGGIFLHAAVVGAVVAAHGLTLPFMPPEKFLVYRILFAYASVSAGLFVLAHRLWDGRWRRVTRFLAAIVVFYFVLHANEWHTFLAAKNLYDGRVAAEITSRLERHPEYQKRLPLVVVGTIDNNELPYAKAYRRAYGLSKRPSPIWTVVSNSAFAAPWSAPRWLAAYMRVTLANEAQEEAAIRYARTLPSFPAQDSVTIADGVMIVNLGSP